MSVNAGKSDRLVRAVLGFVLIVLPFVSGWALFGATWATVVSVFLGLVMLATAATGWCALYAIPGIRTCRL